MKRGDVYWASLVPRSGSEQSGRRPVIILSHDAFNQTPGWRSIIVVPVSTSTAQARRGPTVVALSAGTAGLPSASHVVCHQITTLDRAKLTDRIGALPHDALMLVEQAILTAIDVQRYS
jgi:mRNA interferase MazF